MENDTVVPESYHPVSPEMVGDVPYDTIPAEGGFTESARKYWVTAVDAMDWGDEIAVTSRAVMTPAVLTGVKVAPLTE
jgi:hypothetical protein